MNRPAKMSDGSGTVAVGIGAALARVGGVLYVSTTAAATQGTSEEVLHTYSLPANTLSENGRGIRITATATHAANTNSATIRIRFGGIAGTIIGGVASTTSGASYRVVCEIYRTGAATQLSTSVSAAGTASAILSAAPTQTLSGAIDLVVDGVTATSAGDLTFTSLMVEAL